MSVFRPQWRIERYRRRPVFFASAAAAIDNAGRYVTSDYVLPDYVFAYNLARPMADVSNSGWRGVLV